MQLSSFASRRKWKYMGVWERSPKKQRLHFHGIFYIPEGSIPGELLPFKDYSFSTHRMQVTWQSLYFNEHFGRSDFERIEDKYRMGEALAYLMKYLEKTGERIVYSKGLPQFFNPAKMRAAETAPIVVFKFFMLFFISQLMQ